MPPKSSDGKELGRGLALAQVGLEMVVPIGAGVFLDQRFGWAPGGVIGGAVIGLVGGLFHLIHLAGRSDEGDKNGPSGPEAGSH